MKKKTLILIALSALVLVIAIGSTTVAWFFERHSVVVTESGGSVLTQYFHQGTGTAEDPYEITRPIHYYNLVMLYQVNPEFDEENQFVSESLYFRLGTKDLDLDGVDEQEEFVVFDYNDDGTTDGDSSDTLNLATYEDGIFPIGSANMPFEANFDGSGLTVENLKIVSPASLNSETFKTPDIGIFGYMASSAHVSDFYVKNFSIDLSGVDATADYQESETETEHQSHIGTAYVGYIAGHIVLGAQVEDVYINDCTIIGGSSATSEFGYFGHVENAEGISVTTLGSQIATARSKGNEAGFGGSLDIKNLFERLTMVRSKTVTSQSPYVATETVTVNKATGETTVSRTFDNSNVSNYYYYSNGSDQYVFYDTIGNTTATNTNDYGTRSLSAENFEIFKQTSYAGYEFMWGGGNKTKAVTTYTYKDEFLDAWFIKDGTSYLSLNGTSVSAETTQENAAQWLWDSSNHLYTVIDTVNYYLNRSGTTGVTLGTTASTAWTKNSDNELYTTISGTNYYLDYNSGWQLTNLKEWYYISDDNGHYLSGTTAGVANVDNADDSVKWIVSNPSGNTTAISTTIGGTVYYLCYNNGLTMNTSAFTWYKDGDGYYTEISGEMLYIMYDGSWKADFIEGYTLKSGDYYTSVSGTALSGTTVENNAQRWFVTDSGSSKTIYTITNGSKYYLAYSNGVALTAGSYSWSYDSGGCYVLINSTKCYLVYDSGWTVKPETGYSVYSDSTHYLSANGTSIVNSATESTLWQLSSTAGNTTVFTIINGAAYYLTCDNSGSLSLTTAQVTWTKDTNGWYLTKNGLNYYLMYDDGWKAEIVSGYIISSGSNYLKASSASAVGNGTALDYTLWQFSSETGNTQIYTIINGAKYYIHFNNGSVDISTSDTTWIRSGNSFFYTYNSEDYYLTYENGWTLVKLTYYVISDNGGNYLMVNGANSFGNAESEDSATHFYVDGSKYYCIVNGTKYYLYNSVSNNTGTLNTTTASDTATLWTNYDASLFVTSGNYKYAIGYDTTNSWHIETIYNGILITDGNGNYLQITGTGTTGFANTTNVNEATRFSFSTSGTNPSGYISAAYNGTTVYLRNNSGTLNLTTNTNYGTSWSNNGSNFYSSYTSGSGWSQTTNTTYLIFNGTWQLSADTSRQAGYTISYTNGGTTYYLNATTSKIEAETDASSATVWQGTPLAGSGNGKITTTINGTIYYLQNSSSNGQSLRITTSSTNGTTWYWNTENRLRSGSNNSARYIRYNSGWTASTNNSNNKLTFTSVEAMTFYSTTETVNIAAPSVEVESKSAETPEVTVSAWSITPNANYEKYSPALPVWVETDISVAVPALSCEKQTAYYSLEWIDTQFQVYEKNTSSVTSDFTVYPLRLKLTDADNLLSFTDDFQVDSKNTGYLVSGSSSGSNGNMRVTVFPIGNLWRSLNGSDNKDWTYNASYSEEKLQILTTTDGTFYRIDDGIADVSSSNTSTATDSMLGQSPALSTFSSKTVEALGLTSYTNAKENLISMFESDPTRIYGLRFMSATISKNNTVRAKEVTIYNDAKKKSGSVYQNYELPENAFDFNIVERGNISFFAGTYVSGNTCFFSIHQVFRYEDDPTSIEDICEIDKIYSTDNGSNDPYLYLYTNGKYGQGEAIPTCSTIAEANAKYGKTYKTSNLEFDLSWINNTASSNYTYFTCYYFEVPVNKGEYALGSSSHGNGCYLFYLDIATNGGDVLSTVISSEGTDVTNAFKTEYRYAPDSLGDEEYSVLLFAYDAPGDADGDTFSVTVEFDKNASQGGGDAEYYTKGVYTITVLNKSDEDITLDIFLCDDDRDSTNDFLYAYKVVYTNNSNTAKIIQTKLETDYWQQMATFTIPSTGDAEENSYDA